MIPESISDVASLLTNGAIDFVLPFIAVIAVLVFIHELGHYLVARWCGVRVETFSIGFGPKLFGWKDGHGTEWKICLLPLGGYVQMFGDANAASAGTTAMVKDKTTGVERPMTDVEQSEAFFTKSVGKRAAVVFAGPAINFIFAIIVLAGVYTAFGKPITPPVIGAVIAGSVGDKAGLQPGDRILTMDGREITRFSDVQRHIAIVLDQPVTIKFMRGTEEREITVVPERQEVKDRFGFKHDRGLVGVIGPSLALRPESLTSLNGQKLTTLNDAEKRQLLVDNLGRDLVVTTVNGATGIDKALKIRPPVAANQNLMASDATDKAKALALSDIDGLEFQKLGVFAAMQASIAEVYYLSRATLESLWQMVSGTRSAQELGGLIRIGAVAGDAAAGGFIAFLVFGAMLSINLGLINLFPIPMLDGGHLVFYAIEAIFKRPVPPKTQEWAFKIGFALLISLMLFANLNDVYQLVTR